MGVGRPAVVVEDLDLVAAAQADAAIGILDDPEIHVQFEIPELLLGDDVGGGRGVAQNAVLDGPLHFGIGHERLPSGDIFTVEERDGGAFFPGAVVAIGDLGSANAGPFQGRRARSFGFERAFQLAAHQARVIDVLSGGGCFGPLSRGPGRRDDGEEQLAVLHVDGIDVVHVAVVGAHEFSGGRRGSDTGQLHPPGSRTRRGGRDVPPSVEILVGGEGWARGQQKRHK